MPFLLQHHSNLVPDLSDGLRDALGATPDLYIRAKDASPGTVSSWPAIIGTDRPGTNTPAYNATGVDGGPSVDLRSGDYFSLAPLVAPQAADESNPWVMAMRIRRVATPTAHVFSFGDLGQNTMFTSIYMSSTGAVGFSSRGADSVSDVSVLSTDTITVNDDVSIVARFNGSNIRVIVRDGGGETEFLNNAAVLSVGQYPYAALMLGRLARTTAAPWDGNIERACFWTGYTPSDAQMTATATLLESLGGT